MIGTLKDILVIILHNICLVLTCYVKSCLLVKSRGLVSLYQMWDCHYHLNPVALLTKISLKRSDIQLVVTQQIIAFFFNLVCNCGFWTGIKIKIRWNWLIWVLIKYLHNRDFLLNGLNWLIRQICEALNYKLNRLANKEMKYSLSDKNRRKSMWIYHSKLY